MQITDNLAKFQPLVEEDIEQVNAGANLNVKWASEPITAENAGERLVTRMERETFSRFPRTQAILFTIRTHMKPLSNFEGKPVKVPLLAGFFTGLSDQANPGTGKPAFHDNWYDCRQASWPMRCAIYTPRLHSTRRLQPSGSRRWSIWTALPLESRHRRRGRPCRPEN